MKNRRYGGIIVTLTKQIALLGPDPYSTDLAERVTQILRTEFGFEVDYIPPDEFKLGRFNDSETKNIASDEVLKKLEGEYVALIHNTRVYDGTVPKNQNEESKTSPLYLTAQLFNFLQKLRYGLAARIVWATAKTSYEWSHQLEKHLLMDGEHQMCTLDQFIFNLAAHRLDSWIILHPHAGKEVEPYARQYGLDTLLELHPTSRDRINGYQIDRERALGDTLLDPKHSAPFSYYLRCLFGEIQDAEVSVYPGEYTPETTFIDAPDLGAIPDAQDFTGQHGCRYILSLKDREGEGDSTRNKADIDSQTLEGIVSIDPTLYIPNLGNRLAELAASKKKAIIKIIIIDDKINSGKTANDEARDRINEVTDWVTAYNVTHEGNEVEYTPEVELWCSHLRQPDLSTLKLSNIKKVVILDSVTYVPSMEDQLEKLGLRDKFTILKSTAYQLAMGIAIDYALYQGIFRDPEPDEVIKAKKEKKELYDMIRPPRFMPRYQIPQVKGVLR